MYNKTSGFSIIRQFLLIFPLLGFIVPMNETYRVAFMAIWMITWWIFDVAPLGATALIPMIFLPVMKLTPLKEITPYYADPMIFLFLGGFIIARGLEKTELSERFALNVLHLTGRSDSGIVAGFIIATSLLSMWISNTATAIMMLPIAASVLKFLEKNTDYKELDFKNLSTVIYLSIAYSANIGGTMTPIGTPPNVLLMGFLENIYDIKIDFWKWMTIMIPVSAVFLFIMFFILKKFFPFNVPISRKFRDFIKSKMSELLPFTRAQKLALFIFSLSSFLWVFKDLINHLMSYKLLDDTMIAVLGGSLFFFIPYNLKEFKRILDEQDIPTLPWNIILLFGGGMALAGALEKFGIIEAMVFQFKMIPANSPYILVLLLTTLTLLLTEVMSNVALCMIALPLIMSLATAKGLSPVLAGLPAAVAASYAFTLPISTPPNAIVFGSGKIKMKDMVKAGVILNILGIATIMSFGWVLMKFLV